MIDAATGTAMVGWAGGGGVGGNGAAGTGGARDTCSGGDSGAAENKDGGEGEGGGNGGNEGHLLEGGEKLPLTMVVKFGPTPLGTIAGGTEMMEVDHAVQGTNHSDTPTLYCTHIDTHDFLVIHYVY